MATAEAKIISDRPSTAGIKACAWLPQWRRFALSIRTKGLLVFAVLISYSLVISLFAFQQKNVLLTSFDDIQTALETEVILKQTDVSTFHAVMAILANIDVPDNAEGKQRINMHLQSLRTHLTTLTARLPENALILDDLYAALEAVSLNSSRTNLTHLNIELIKAKDELALLTENIQDSRRSMSERYRTQTDTVALTIFVLGMLGLALLGASIALFFQRLTTDLHTLKVRTLEIVKGFRGKPIPHLRNDEVGQLINAVNNMADILDLRENELMLERQKYFHQEKMAAIGTLAAGITHEIGNPIAAISGIAQEMIERRALSTLNCLAANCHDCRPDLIFTQTQRLAAITREITEFAAPRAASIELLDLNALLRSTSSLIRYDKRLQRVHLQLELDSQLPAIYGVADQLTQLVMNLLINSMDAFDGVEDRAPRILISTRSTTDSVILTIEDNGHGIDQEYLSRVFEAFFTTKPAGKGTGLGLSLCYSITKNHGGTIDINSTLGVGTKVQVAFSLNNPVLSESIIS